MSHNRDESRPCDSQQHTPLLETINSPADVRPLDTNGLKQLADEIRAKIISTASEGGGHLAPHLGVVDLTLALHHVFETPDDLLIWDVGHQCYAHKLVTGRRDQFHTMRKKDGLAGYPTPKESPCDTFGVGHSSTSISAALGMAVARDHRKSKERVIAVIGDGAMTAGMAFEALSHAGALGTDMLVILNDNKMSISENVGALSSYFNRLITGGLYNRAKGDFKTFMERALGHNITWAAQRFEHSVKGFLTPGTLFEALGFKYVGPVDGHDMGALVECLENVKGMSGPIFFHCVTKKGKGYSYAEEDPQTYHGVKAFDIETGKFVSAQPAPQDDAPAFTDAFADALIAAGNENPNIVSITAAMPTGTGLHRFAKKFPARCFDVGICEQHAVTFAAGLAARGLRPVCAIYSTFLQRGFDQVVHDVCIQNLPVVFAIDRAGAVGEDSPTQQGAFDISFLRALPNMRILAPRDAEDTAAMLHWALRQQGPVAVRYARGKAPAIESEAASQFPEREICRGEILREGRDACFLGVGPVLKACIEAAHALEREGYSIGVADARSVKPLDDSLLSQLRGLPLVTVEENTVEGGFGSAVLEHFEAQGWLGEAPVRRLGFPDEFIPHATRDEQLASIGLDTAGLTASMRAFAEEVKRMDRRHPPQAAAS